MTIGLIFFKIILVTILSGIIGLEREIRQKGAGIRTHILVGVGATLVVLTSLFLFDIYKEAPGRLITGIVTGIGFLCGGTIIRAGSQVMGLTTAATLWIVSCIGIAVGVGFYAGAIIGFIVIFATLLGVRSIEKHIHINNTQDDKL